MAAFAYTGVPSPSLNAELDEALAEMGREIDSLRLPHLAGVVLGGGYGRGEGGAWHTPQGDRLYNDLDLFVFADDGAGRREAQAIQDALKRVSETWERRLGVAVDFSPVKTRRALERVARTLMFQELRRGWRPVWGEATPETWIPELDSTELPFTETARLFLNRGMGLVFAGEKLSAGAVSEADFIVRNMNKAVLGCGDALLLAAGKYRWRGLERIAAVEELVRATGFAAEFAEAYRHAFQYKLEPRPVLPDDPQREWQACRRWYLAAVRAVAGVPAAAGVAEVEAGLHRRAVSERSVRQFARWLVKARGIRRWGRLADAPVVTIVAEWLFPLLLAAENAYPACPARLLELWRLFN